VSDTKERKLDKVTSISADFDIKRQTLEWRSRGRGRGYFPLPECADRCEQLCQISLLSSTRMYFEKPVFEFCQRQLPVKVGTLGINHPNSYSVLLIYSHLVVSVRHVAAAECQLAKTPAENKPPFCLKRPVIKDHIKTCVREISNARIDENHACMLSLQRIDDASHGENAQINLYEV